MGLNNAFMSLGRVIGLMWAGMVLDLNLSFPFITGSIRHVDRVCDQLVLFEE